jgi:type I restriction enzyme S subunit
MNYQRKVSAILSSCDDLIENNSRRIEILTETIQAIYDEWFIKFRFPGHDKVKFVDSGLGKIPEGWEERQLVSIADKISNKYIEEEHNKLCLLDLSRIPRKSQVVSEYGKNDEIKTARIIFEKGDILFGAVRPYFHKVVITYHSGITNTSVFVIRPKDENLRYYLFSLLFRDYTIQWATTNSSGAKMPVISWDVFKGMKFAKPQFEIICEYNKIIHPMFEEIGVLNRKNLLLNKSRELLLSRLISGEIDVENMDIALGDSDDR